MKRFVALALPTAMATAISNGANAVGYGVYDARAMGMGNVGVAAGNTENASFYNPALLALHDGDEDKTRDGRLFLPILVAQAQTSLEDAVDIADLNLDDQLSDAVDGFNTDPSPASAQMVSDALTELDSAIDTVGNKDLLVDSFVGFSISEPGDREGGGFFLGTRFIGGGRADVPEEDRAIIDAFQAGMDVLIGGGDVADLDPSLLDGDGNLADPNDQISSSLDIGGVALTEIGVSFAKEFEVWRLPVAFGVTPKVMRADVYREARGYSDGSIEFSDDHKSHFSMNADIGVAVELWDHYRVGLAVKDVLAKDFSTQSDLPVTLRPRPRFGVAYANEFISVGMDVDVTEMEPIAGESPYQDLGVGLEFTPFWGWDIRLGYQMDLTDAREPSVSGGFAYKMSRVALELSYAEGDDSRGVSLQAGWVF